MYKNFTFFLTYVFSISSSWKLVTSDFIVMLRTGLFCGKNKNKNVSLLKVHPDLFKVELGGTAP